LATFEGSVERTGASQPDGEDPALESALAS